VLEHVLGARAQGERVRRRAQLAPRGARHAALDRHRERTADGVPAGHGVGQRTRGLRGSARQVGPPSLAARADQASDAERPRRSAHQPGQRPGDEPSPSQQRAGAHKRQAATLPGGR
jgi:hypothetical protein